MKKILLTFPTSPEHPFLHKFVVMTSWRLLADRRYAVTPKIPTGRPLEDVQHRIVREFLAEGYDYWLSIDNDNPPRRNPLDLVDLDLDIVGCPTPVWHFAAGNGSKRGERPIYYNAYDYVSGEDAYREHPPGEGLQRVDAIGGGCFLVARRVFERPSMQRGAFLRALNPDGTVERGNDIRFCERARAEGFRIWAHYDYLCDHHNYLEINEVTDGFRNLYESCGTKRPTGKE